MRAGLSSFFDRNKRRVLRVRYANIVAHWLVIARRQGGFGNKDARGLDFWLHGKLSARWFAYYLLLRLVVKGKTSLPFLDVHITTRCTLNCKDCNHYTDAYDDRTHRAVTFETFKRDLDNILHVVDSVHMLQIGGGEALLNREMGKMLDYADSRGQVKFILFTTNGTLIPSDEVFERLRLSRKAFVVISQYGSEVQKKREQLIDRLKALGIRHFAYGEQKWFAQWELRKANRPAAELERNLKKCYLASCTAALLDGVIYPCPVSIPIDLVVERDALKDERINVGDGDLREKLKAFYLKTYFDACDFCHIPDRPVWVKPGEQIVRVQRRADPNGKPGEVEDEARFLHD